jgi:hypothetical protein
MATKKQYIDPELQYQIEQIIAGKMSFDKHDYQKILGALWKEFLVYCKEDTKIAKDRDKIVEMLQSW